MLFRINPARDLVTRQERLHIKYKSPRDFTVFKVDARHTQCRDLNIEVSFRVVWCEMVDGRDPLMSIYITITPKLLESGSALAEYQVHKEFLMVQVSMLN